MPVELPRVMKLSIISGRCCRLLCLHSTKIKTKSARKTFRDKPDVPGRQQRHKEPWITMKVKQKLSLKENYKTRTLKGVLAMRRKLHEMLNKIHTSENIG